MFSFWGVGIYDIYLKHGHVYMYALKTLETSMTSSDLVCQTDRLLNLNKIKLLIKLKIIILIKFKIFMTILPDYLKLIEAIKEINLNLEYANTEIFYCIS